ncbi:MAG: hypothetical protein HRF42_11330 [Candidatus Brocadia sp.]|jgi:hypothetical protein
MIKKFGYHLIIVSALILGAGVVNTAVVNFSIAAEENRCDKCGHLPSKPDDNCRCECHTKKR